MLLRFSTLWASLVVSAVAEVRMPAIFSDHMVLQRATDVPFWGRADPGEQVTVALDGQHATTRADAQGRWKLVLDLSRSGAGPHRCAIQASNRIEIADVLIGEAWLASGQSNMDTVLRLAAEADTEIPAAGNTQLRFFKVKQNGRPAPQEDCVGKWVVCSPQSAATFSAVGYFFGQKLQRALGVPVGIVDTSVGGTPVESWISEPMLDSRPELKAGRMRILGELESHPARVKQYAADFDEWLERQGRKDRATADAAAFSRPGIDLRDWQQVRLPGRFAEQGLPDSGAVWLRKQVPVSRRMAGDDLRLDLGQPTGNITVYWEGQKIGESSHRGYPGLETRTTFRVPRALLHEGENVLAIRFFSPAGRAEVRAVASGSNFRAIRDANDRVFLAGEWHAKSEYALPELAADVPRPSAPPGPPPEPRSMGAWLFNGHIHPLIPYAFRGVLWYQGEGNAERAYQYRTTFPLLIEDWRRRWGRNDWPFYFCQLANFGPKKSTPDESAWAELREAQAMTLLVPNTGMAVLIDVGEEGDIHPRDKRSVGERLAAIALTRDYGRTGDAFSPQFSRLERQGDTLRVHFSNAENGLVARPLPPTYQPRSSEARTLPLRRNSPASEVEGFAICGADKLWRWADARVDGSTVLVSAPEVPHPVAVRYGWADNPTVNLYSAAGLPVAPFRSDDFPGVTRANSY